MYTLYYLNRNHQIGTIKVATLDAPVLIPEDLVFCNFRSGVKFIKEPHECIDFTDTERLLMVSEFTDIELLKHYDYRRENTFLNASCTLEQSDTDPRASCCGDTPTPFLYNLFLGERICTAGVVAIDTGVSPAGVEVSSFIAKDQIIVGSLISKPNDETPWEQTFGYNDVLNVYYVLENGVVTEIIASGTSCEMPTFPFFGRVGNIACVDGFKTVSATTNSECTGSSEEFVTGMVIHNEDGSLVNNQLVLVLDQGILLTCNEIGVVTGIEDNAVEPCFRMLLEIEVSAVFPNIVEVSYLLDDGSTGTQSWTADGSGEEVIHSFAVSLPVSEPSITVTGAVWHEYHWF